MLDRDYWRALYNEERNSFVVEQAGWLDGEPQIEYRFSYFTDAEDEDIARLGGLDKRWLNDDGFGEGEFFAFGRYPDAASFDADVAQILDEAKKRSHEANLDYFLAVTDIVKERAVEAELEDDSIFEYDGLFELGDEDAYSLQLSDAERLHDHVERSQDECWHLQVVRVVDPQQQPLGWCLCAVLYPSLNSEATAEQIAAAPLVHLLDLDHFHTYGEAVLAKNGTLRFMLEDGRVQDPEYAYMNDSEVLELMSVQCSVEEIIAPVWDILQGENLRALIDHRQPLIRERERWHPREVDVVAHAATAMGLPMHVADQVFAELLDGMKLTEPADDNNPWYRALNEEPNSDETSE